MNQEQLAALTDEQLHWEYTYHQMHRISKCSVVAVLVLGLVPCILVGWWLFPLTVALIGITLMVANLSIQLHLTQAPEHDAKANAERLHAWVAAGKPKL